MVIEFCKVNPSLCPRQLRAVMNWDEITKRSKGSHYRNSPIANQLSPSMKEVLSERIDSVLEDETLFPQASVKSETELTQKEKDYAVDRLHILKILEKLMTMKNSSRLSNEGVLKLLKKFQFHHSETTGDKIFDEFI